MRRQVGWLVMVSLVASCLSGLTIGSRIASAQGPAGGPPSGGGRPPGFGMMPPDSFAADRDTMLAELREHYAGKLDQPADSVFKNLKVMHGRTVAQFLNGMNGLGRSLGTSCTHCHIANHWADDDKSAKDKCRDMIRMTDKINKEVMPTLTAFGDDKPHVGCFTCHHGQVRPGGMGRPPGGPGGMRREGDRDHDRH